MSTEAYPSVVQEVASALGETDEAPLNQLVRLLEVKGEDFLKEVLAETLAIEEKGGMKTHKGNRRRTPGGVFFFLVKGKLEPELRADVFPNFGTTKKGTVIAWDDRQEIVEETQKQPGRARIVTAQVQGVVDKVEIRETSVVLSLLYSHEKSMTYPRGVPYPPHDDSQITVYMGLAHWEGVEKALSSSDKDEILVTGTLFYDEETRSIAIFSSHVTTRLTERHAQRAAREAAAKEAAKAEKAAQAEPNKKGKPDARQPASKQNGKNDKKGKGKSSAPAELPTVTADVKLPDNLPADVAEKLTQLHNAAATLRERVAVKEAKGQKTQLEEKLLRNTLNQIESLEKQYVK